MSDKTFPFPGRELAASELSRDPCHVKILPKDREKVVEMAWKKGEKAAKMIFERYEGSHDFFYIAEQSGLKCVQVDADYVVGNDRYFSDYLTGRKRIRLFTKSISRWAKKNSLTLHEAKNLILSHEYFHFLEFTEIGLTSRDYQVPMLVIGNFKLGRTGVRALSEIGAHAFAWKYHELTAGVHSETKE